MTDNSFTETGEGDPVICLLEGNAAALTDALSEDFAVFARSPDRLDGANAVSRAEALLAVADARGLSKFALLAQGEDCASALAAAALRPQAIETLVLMSPRLLDEHGTPRDVSLAGLLGKVEAQTLALFGTRSAIASPSTGGRYKRALSKCHLIYVYDADDTGSERLEAVSEVVLDFLKRREAFLVSNKDGRVHA